jgi:hypothetical protein
VINFRYHLVSLVAVFLALAIGIVAGSTVIQESLVDSLRASVNTAERRLDEVQGRNQELEAELAVTQSRSQALGEEGPDQLLRDRVAGLPVLLVTVAGADARPVEGLARSIRSSGGEVAGVVRVEDRMLLENPDDLAELAALLGEPPTEDPQVLRDALAERLAELLVALGWPDTEDVPTDEDALEVGGTLTAATNELRDLLADLDDAGFFEVDDLTSEALIAGVRVVVHSGDGATVSHDLFARPLLERVADDERPIAVAVEATFPLPEEDTEERNTFVGPLRDSNRLRRGLSTVDDVEAFDGWAATVLALAELADGRVGHYGIGDGADRLLPPPQQ